MEGVAPGHPVVTVAELEQTSVVAARAERLLERTVRGQVLLDGAAGEHDRDRPLGRLRWTPPTKRDDPLVAREATARSSRRGGRSCRTGGRARRSSPGGAGACGRARARRGSRRARSGSAPSGAAGGSPRRAPASTAPRRSRSRSGRPGRSAPREAAAAARDSVSERRVLDVLGAVVRDEERAALGRVRMRPDQGRQLELEDPALDRDRLRLADRFVRDPGGRLVAGLLPDGLAPPRAGGAASGCRGRGPTRSSRSRRSARAGTRTGPRPARARSAPRCGPFRVSSCGSRSRSWWARRTAARRRRGSGNWKRSSITEVCRVCGNSRAEPSVSAGAGRFGH